MTTDGTKWVYRFGRGAAEGRGDMRNLLGGKGAGLAEMSNLGLPVPPGFTITTEVCTHFYANDRTYPAELRDQVAEALADIEQAIGARFGDPRMPLLVSVRSGARASMPGMMDTVLNLGLNDDTVKGLARRSGDERFAYDSYRRFLQMYGQVVLGIEHHHFEALIEDHKLEIDAVLDTDLGAEDWQTIVAGFKDVVQAETGKPFPQDPQEQLWGAIAAVFGSWMNARAVTYRRLHHIPADWGTAVNVQAMVFGNMGEDCATGVAFTRNPSTGANEFYGEYLVNAQGEDVVAGIRTPQHLTIAGKQGQQLDPAGDGRGDAGGVRRAAEGARHPRRPLPRHAGHRVHGRARQAVDAADPHRQAHRAGGAEDRGGAGRGGPHRPRRGDPPHRAGFARPAACIRRSTPAPRRRCWRAACRPRPAPPRARSCSRPTRPKRRRPAARR